MSGSTPSIVWFVAGVAGAAAASAAVHLLFEHTKKAAGRVHELGRVQAPDEVLDAGLATAEELISRSPTMWAFMLGESMYALVKAVDDEGHASWKIMGPEPGDEFVDWLGRKIDKGAKSLERDV